MALAAPASTEANNSSHHNSTASIPKALTDMSSLKHKHINRSDYQL